MSKIDYRVIRMSCDACGDTQDFEQFSTYQAISDAGWTSIIVAKYGAARYGDEHDLCPKCGAAARTLIKETREAGDAREAAVTPEVAADALISALNEVTP